MFKCKSIWNENSFPQILHKWDNEVTREGAEALTGVIIDGKD